MYHRNRRKMIAIIVCGLASIAIALPQPNITIENKNGLDDNLDNNLIDFDEDYAVKFNKNYGGVPWNENENYKESNRYTLVKDDVNESKLANKNDKNKDVNTKDNLNLETTTNTAEDSSIPLELISTTVDPLVSIIESTNEPDLSVIPLTTVKQSFPEVVIKQTVTLPPSTQTPDTTTNEISSTTNYIKPNSFQSATKHEIFVQRKENTTQKDDLIVTATNIPTSIVNTASVPEKVQIEDRISNAHIMNNGDTDKILEIATDDKKNEGTTASSASTVEKNDSNANKTLIPESKTVTSTQLTVETSSETTDSTTRNQISTTTVKPKRKSGRRKSKPKNATTENPNTTTTKPTNITQKENKNNETITIEDSIEDPDTIPIFTGLDTEEEIEVPEDYYDSKDVLPTSAPKTDALSVIFGLAGSMVESVVESVAERVVPKGIFDLFKRMQKQSEALEAERLRSREENGGLGQFGRGLLKSISTGLSRPLTQLMAGAKDIGSLDTDRGFVASVTNGLTRGVSSGVTTVANAATSLAEAFKDRVQAIYPGTVWCGDGHVASARSGELGLFFFTDTCCRQHDACKIYIRAGETKYNLTNTGLFTRSHCGCDLKFRECLRRTNSLVSAQIGLTYFNVLGPQCFRKAHPITRCIRRTRITGQKCEEYELDFTKPKMWQWFDNETF